MQPLGGAPIEREPPEQDHSRHRVRRLREALGYESPGRKWHVRAIIAVTAVVLLLIGVGGYATFQHLVEQGPAEAEAKRKMDQGVAYAKKGDFDRAITEYNEAIRLDPKNAGAFFSRGVAYAEKGDRDLAIADSSEAIRLNPERFAWVYCIRGTAKLKKNDSSGNADIAKARQLDPSTCR
jgi:tetratricopeptide (TPR) repeat protein